MYVLLFLVIKEDEKGRRGRRHNKAVRVCALHKANQGSMTNVLYDPSSPPGVIPDAQPGGITGVTPKQPQQKNTYGSDGKKTMALLIIKKIDLNINP